MFGTVGPMEVLVLLAIVIMIFGGNRIASLGKGLGDGIGNLRRALRRDKTDGDEDGE